MDNILNFEIQIQLKTISIIIKNKYPLYTFEIEQHPTSYYNRSWLLDVFKRAEKIPDVFDIVWNYIQNNSNISYDAYNLSNLLSFWTPRAQYDLWHYVNKCNWSLRFEMHMKYVSIDSRFWDHYGGPLPLEFYIKSLLRDQIVSRVADRSGRMSVINVCNLCVIRVMRALYDTNHNDKTIDPVYSTEINTIGSKDFKELTPSEKQFLKKTFARVNVQRGCNFKLWQLIQRYVVIYTSVICIRKTMPYLYYELIPHILSA